MRVAIVTDIHGNRTAFEAVLADLREVSPDLVLHGGDLADGGSSPVEVVDRIRDLGWAGVTGNGEEALVTPETLDEFARGSKAPASLWDALREMMAWGRERLGEDRLRWLGALPRAHLGDGFALVHAAPSDPWRAPESGTFVELGRPVVVYGHIHRPSISVKGTVTVVNAGSVGLPYDGDPRASYAVLDHGSPSIRRVAYDVEREIQTLMTSGLPHAEWVARLLRSAAPQIP